MITYVNTVLVSNISDANVLTSAPANADSLNTPSDDYGKFIIMNCDPDATSVYVASASEAASAKTIKVGIVTKKNAVVRNNNTVTYMPIVKWSNEIKADDIKSFSALSYSDDSEDTVEIDFDGMSDFTVADFAEGGRRIIVRLTFKDMPNRYRKWTESYEYVTKKADLSDADATKIADYKEKIAADIAYMINKEWKRARVQATADGTKVSIVALPYDDDDSVDSLSWASKVRFNANIYYTNPTADGWASLNKNYPEGVVISKTPGKQYPASAKLVRDRESQAMGYQGILNRGEGTWPIIKPEMETKLDGKYDALTLEFENMYRAADDIFRKTKQTVEMYGVTGNMGNLQSIIAAFVSREASTASSN